MPYFYSKLYTKLGQRRETYLASTEGLKYCCATPSNATSKRMLGVFLPLTLDEYCNPVLNEKKLDDRNQDQVLVRYERNKEIEKEKERQECRDGLIKKKNAKKKKGLQDQEQEKKIPPSTKLITLQQA